MINKSILKKAFIIMSIGFVLTISSYAQTDCSKTTDAEIVDAIYARLKVKYENQLDHVNVRVKDGVVTLEGWVTKKGIKKDFEKIAKKTKCVKSVVNNLTIGVGGGCAAGQKPCGGICIDSAETCNIKTKGT